MVKLGLVALVAVGAVAGGTWALEVFLSRRPDGSWADAASISLTFALTATTVVYAYLTRQIVTSQNAATTQVRDLEYRRATADVWAQMVRGVPGLTGLASNYPVTFGGDDPEFELHDVHLTLEQLGSGLVAASAQLPPELSAKASECGKQMVLAGSDAVAMRQVIVAERSRAGSAGMSMAEAEARNHYLTKIRPENGSEWENLLAGTSVRLAQQTCADFAASLRTYLEI